MTSEDDRLQIPSILTRGAAPNAAVQEANRQAQYLYDRTLRLSSALEKAAAKFMEYGKLHESKDPPALDKAKVNFEMANMCREAIDDTMRPSVGEFMEKQLADPETKAVYERLAKR